MIKKTIISALALMSLALLPSCKNDRDVQDSIKGSTSTSDISSLPKHTERIAFNGAFSLDPLELDVPSNNDEEGLRALQFKLSQTGTTLKEGRKIKYRFNDGEQLDAMLIMRCKGQTVDTSSSDQTQVPMPFFHRMIKLTYHQTGKHAGKFTPEFNHFDFEWNGPSFEDIKTNANGRQWQVMVALTKGMSNLPVTDSKPTKFKVPVGDLTDDGKDTASTIDPDRPIYNLNELELDKNLTTGFLDMTATNKDTEVPFYSDWLDIEFSDYGKGVTTDLVTGAHDKTEKPRYSLDIVKQADGTKGANIHLKPKGVFILLDLNTANTTPFDIYSRGLRIQTSAYSFAGNFDFSETAFKDNNDLPKWTANEQFVKYPLDKQMNLYAKDFRFAKLKSGNTELLFTKDDKKGRDHLFLFWAMPLDIKGVHKDKYFTQFYLHCRVGGDIAQGGYGDPNEKEKFIKTNYNIAKIDKGEVAAVMPGDHGFTTDDILDGEFGKAKAYVRHGLIGNRKVWLHMPSIRNFPLYSSKGKRVFTANDEAAGKGKAGQLKHGRIMYATSQHIARPIMFLEYMSETPCVNTKLIKEQGNAVAGPEGNYWNENLNDLMAYKLTPHRNLDRRKPQTFLPNARNSDERGDEFHFAYDYAQDLAADHSLNSYGYQNKLPENISYGTYFRETIGGKLGRRTDLEEIPNPNKNNTVKEVWYYVKFKNSADMVLQYNGEGKKVTVEKKMAGNTNQLWKFFGTQDDFELVSKNNNSIFHWNASDRRFYADAKENEELRLYQHNGNWLMEAEYLPHNTSINSWGGFTAGNEVGAWNQNDDKNALEILDQQGNPVDVPNIEYSDLGEGPWRITQNFTSQLPFESTPKERHTYVWKGSNKIIYAVRYMDHKGDDVTCTKAYHRDSPTHEDNKWENCNRRRCVVRYEVGPGMYSVTARYVGVNDALATIKNPIWANENFWKHNQEDDVVRYYTGYGYVYVGSFYNMGSIFWTSQKALEGAPANSKEIIQLECGNVNGHYGAYHPYGCIRKDRVRQDRLPFYLFMDIRKWRDVPTSRGYSK